MSNTRSLLLCLLALCSCVWGGRTEVYPYGDAGLSGASGTGALTAEGHKAVLEPAGKIRLELNRPLPEGAHVTVWVSADACEPSFQCNVLSTGDVTLPEKTWQVVLPLDTSVDAKRNVFLTVEANDQTVFDLKSRVDERTVRVILDRK